MVQVMLFGVKLRHHVELQSATGIHRICLLAYMIHKPYYSHLPPAVYQLSSSMCIIEVQYHRYVLLSACGAVAHLLPVLSSSCLCFVVPKHRPDSRPKNWDHSTFLLLGAKMLVSHAGYSASQMNSSKGAGMPVLFCSKHARWNVDCHKHCKEMCTASGSVQDPARNPHQS